MIVFNKRNDIIMICQEYTHQFIMINLLCSSFPSYKTEIKTLFQENLTISIATPL